MARELGIDEPVDIRALLDVARVAAHRVDRPAAPLTTYLVGWAAARGGGAAAVPGVIERVEALAREWEARQAPGGSEGEAGATPMP